jgi:hypothetical protein
MTWHLVHVVVRQESTPGDPVAPQGIIIVIVQDMKTLGSKLARALDVENCHCIPSQRHLGMVGISVRVSVCVWKTEGVKVYMVNAAYVRAERIASHRAVPQVFGVDFVIFEGALVPQQTVKLGSATLDP